MFGTDSFGSSPYGAGTGPEGLFDVDAALADSRAQRVVTLVIEARELGEVGDLQFLHFASTEWATEPTDVPASQPFEDRLLSYAFNQSAAGGERFGGLVAGSGQLVLANTDGGLDALIDGYSLAGRRFKVRLGRVSDAFENHLIIRRGVIDEAEADDEKVTLSVSDGKRLDVPAQANVYAGTTGSDPIGLGSELVSNGTFNSNISGWTLGYAGSWAWDAGGGNGRAITAEAAELVTNGTFNSDLTGWSVSGWEWNSGGGNGMARATGFDLLSQTITTVNGATYRIRVTPRGGSAGTCRVRFGGAVLGTFAYTGSAQTFTVVAAGTSNALSFENVSPGFLLGGIDNVSVKRVDPATISQTITTADGSSYRIAVTPRGGSGNCTVKFGGATIGSFSFGAGAQIFNVVAAGTSNAISIEAATSAGVPGSGIDDVSVKLILEGPQGGPDVEGKRMPLTFGEAAGVPPVLVHSGLLIYQVHDHDDADGFVSETTVVYDRGVALTMLATVADYAAIEGASLSAGQAMSSRDGYFRIGGSLAGVVFATVQCWPADAAGATTVDVIRAILARQDILGANEIDHGSFHALEADPSSSLIGVHIAATDSVTVGEFIANLMAGIGGWAGFNRRGQLALGIIDAPAGDPVATFRRGEGDIVDLSRERLPSGVWPPPWRWRVAYGRNYTVFTDFAGSVPAEERLFYAEPYRLIQADDAVFDDYPTAQDTPPVEAYYLDLGQAHAEASRLLALYRGDHRLYRITLGREALRLEIGAVIHVTWPRWGLDAGKNLVVVAIDDRIEMGEAAAGISVEVLAFG